MGTYHILTGYFLPIDKKEVQMQYFPSPLTIITRISMSGCLPFWRLLWSARWAPPWPRLPRVSGLGFEVRLGLAGLGRCLVLGQSRNCSSGELDIRDSVLIGFCLGHDAYVNNRIFVFCFFEDSDKDKDDWHMDILLSESDGQQTNSWYYEARFRLCGVVYSALTWPGINN